MDFFNILTLIGGLALFLFGMDTMGGGLTTLSGGRMEQILEKLTNNLFKGVALGALVTAIIQSSSATTVMVVALVNASVMKLQQAVGVIMGANIGTTVTSWLLSLTGIESDNFFIELIKPSSFSPVLAIIAVGILMMSKKDSKKSIASIMIGFAILMFGMETMTAAVAPLKDIPEFTNLFLLFSNPIIGMLVGAILTAIIQSSSASVGILQALSATGAITFGSAIPIIMGQNIGTCVTAIISSIGTSKNARRTACIHLTFNVIGTAIFMTLFYGLNVFVHFPFLDEAITPVSIAIVHTVFNLLATACLLPFSKGLVKIATLIIRDKPSDIELKVDSIQEELKRLDRHFLEKPGFAVEQAHTTMVLMAGHTRKALELALESLVDYSDERFALVESLEKRVDQFEDALSSYLMELSSCVLNDRDNRKLTIMIHSLTDIERISDHAINIAEQARKKASASQEFSAAAMSDIRIYSESLLDIVDRAFRSFENNDPIYAQTIEPLEQRIDDLDIEFNNRHIARLRQGMCSVELGLIISELYNNMERVSDHCSNIGICIIQFSERKYTKHEYTSDLNKTQGNFADLYRQFAEKYSLVDESADKVLADTTNTPHGAEDHGDGSPAYFAEDQVQSAEEKQHQPVSASPGQSTTL